MIGLVPLVAKETVMTAILSENQLNTLLRRAQKLPSLRPSTGLHSRRPELRAQRL